MDTPLQVVVSQKYLHFNHKRSLCVDWKWPQWDWSVTCNWFTSVYYWLGQNKTSSQQDMSTMLGWMCFTLCKSESKTVRDTINHQLPWTSIDAILRPHLCCMCFLPNQVGRHSGRHPRGRSRCLHYCRWLRHTASRLARITKKHWGHRRSSYDYS